MLGLLLLFNADVDNIHPAAMLARETAAKVDSETEEDVEELMIKGCVW